MQNKINAKKRDLLGKKVKNIRKDGFVPASIYGSDTISQSITIPYGEIEKVLRTATLTSIIDMDVDGAEIKALIKEVQRDLITNEINHVSFFKIDEKAEMLFEIPIYLTGIAPAVKNNLGALVQTMNSVEVRCKVADLVPSFTVDISKLDGPGQTIKLSEVSMPEAIKLVHKEDLHSTIVTITELQSEEVTATTTEETPAATDEKAAETKEEPTEDKK